MIEFRIDGHSGVAPYRQIVDQVRQAIALGHVRRGDQLPTVKEVVGQVAVNPNTVLKAYRDLEREGLAAGRPGVGTFVTAEVDSAATATQRTLGDELAAWVGRARAAGLSEAQVADLVQATLRDGAEGAA